MLLEYIPEFLRDIGEFKEIFGVLDGELEKLKAIGAEVFENQYILSCERECIFRFEKILGIENSENLELEARRKRLILKFNEKLPYTAFRFGESLDFICGEGNYFFIVENEEYLLVLRLFSGEEGIRKEVFDLIDRMIPANMKVFVVLFNTHRIVGRVKHGDLERYTHGEVCSEKL